MQVSKVVVPYVIRRWGGLTNAMAPTSTAMLAKTIHHPNPDYPHRAWHNKKAKLEEKDASSISRKKGTKVNLVKYHCRLLIRGRSLVPEHFTDCAKAM
jgi:hypothetical protein